MSEILEPPSGRAPITGYRLSREPYTSKTQAFDGEGAFRTGRRWNSKGVRCVYVASSIALASLEILVNLEDVETLRAHYIVYRVRFPAGIMQTVMPNGNLSRLPTDWDATPKPPSTKAIGDAWVKGTSSAVLEVPSAVVRLEANYVLNPLHPDFGGIEIDDGRPYLMDHRLERGLG